MYVAIKCLCFRQHLFFWLHFEVTKNCLRSLFQILFEIKFFNTAIENTLNINMVILCCNVVCTFNAISAPRASYIIP